MHVAKFQPSFQKALVEVATHKNKGWVGIVCASNKVANDCQYNADPSISNIQAIYVEALSPTLAEPYKVVYGGQRNELTDSILVTNPTGFGIVIVRVSDRRIECFLSCRSGCQDCCK